MPLFVFPTSIIVFTHTSMVIYSSLDRHGLIGLVVSVLSALSAVQYMITEPKAVHLLPSLFYTSEDIGLLFG